jgi:hypothetical protein
LILLLFSGSLNKYPYLLIYFLKQAVIFPVREKGSLFSFKEHKNQAPSDKRGADPISSSFTEYPPFCYKARNLLTSKEKEFLIRLLR